MSTHPRVSSDLKRILGAPTALLVSLGVAIGSGIFRTPGEVAGQLQSPAIIVLAWIGGGAFVLLAGMVTAELATRYPQAGGEYVYLREAYGDFAAFFFGWSYTVFVIGAGAATIASGFGDFASDLLGIDSQRWSGILAAAAVVAITVVNALGLRVGAGTQNLLTIIKVLALVAVAIIGLIWGSTRIGMFRSVPDAGGWSLFVLFALGFNQVNWAYAGTTDTAKLAEEVKDVRRAMPRALIGSAVAATVLYVAVNLAFMRIIPLEEMAGIALVPGEAMGRLFGPAGRNAMLVVAMLVCLSSLSATVLATIRVTFALARDGLTFRFMARMSRAQAPVPALLLVCGFAVVLVLRRDFNQVVQIYGITGAILFDLAYASLIVFRMREKEIPAHVYRCPAGPWMAIALILVQSAIAVGIVIHSPTDALYAALLLVFFGLLYFVWRKGAGKATA